MSPCGQVVLCFLALFVVACYCKCGSGLIDQGVSARDARVIVEKHNQLRTLIAQGRVKGQPQAKNMRRMIWDKSLAQAAQAVANNCVFAHAKIHDNRFKVGQNLYITYNTKYNTSTEWNSGVQSWFDEHYTYKFGPSVFNHYTQVVWASTYLVGCGYTHYKEGIWYNKLYVCNYGPAGNFLGQRPYEVGKGCTNLC